jgi:hypothetical protein
MKYFYASNATRKIKTEHFTFKFEPCSMVASIWAGTYATENSQEVVELSDVKGVKEITELEYKELLKKKPSTQTLGGFKSSVVVRATMEDLATHAAKATKASQEVVVPTVQDIESLIHTAPVTPSVPLAVITPRKGK